MFDLKFSFSLVFYLALTINSGNCQCLLHFNDISPLIVRNIGTAQLPFQYNDVNNTLKMIDGETVVLYCPTVLDPSPSIGLCTQNQKRLALRCKNSALFCETGQQSISGIQKMNFSCETLGPALYETKSKLKNCTEYQSYAFGITSVANKELVQAAVCYDISNLSLKYVTYYSSYERYDPTLKEQIKGFNDVSFNAPFRDYHTFYQYVMKSRSNIAMLQAKEQKNDLIRNYQFDYETILQNFLLQSDLMAHANMFEVIWWRNLRLGNWQFFKEAYHNFTRTVEHKIYIGTSGQLSAPTRIERQVESFVIERDGVKISTNAPEIIWFYIQPLKKLDITEEIVFVGINTPFYEIGSTPFCKDVCQEVQWLKGSIFLKTHLMPSVGMMHCCRVAEVARKLDNFPL